MAHASTPGREPTEAEKRDNVVRLAFGGDLAKLNRFIDVIREYLPEDTGVVLRGSAVTGFRWKDGAPFDSEGPGTSDLDVTLVGAPILDYYKVTGFFVPGVHSRPLSDDDPDIAPELVPLRTRLMDMVRRPVNIQGTRDFVMYLRGELMGQPYLTLIDKHADASGTERPGGAGASEASPSEQPTGSPARSVGATTGPQGRLRAPKK